jgi:hypothetical protein
MSNFPRALVVSLRSLPFRPRRADVRPQTRRHGTAARAIGGIIAAVLLLSTSGVASARLDGSPEWTQAVAFHAVPAVHSQAFQHGAFESRSPRRAWPHVDLPLATHASQSIGLATKFVAFPAVRPQPAAVVARGYDATAPPVS